MSSDRLWRQGRIAWKLVASRREARTLAELNGDMRARADMMHGCGIGGANHQQAQGAQNQSGTHPHHSVSNKFPSCAHAPPRSQGASASRPVKSAGSWGGIGPAKITFAEMCETGREPRACLLCGLSVQPLPGPSAPIAGLRISDARSAAGVAPTCRLI